jgi:hypothetical protein
VVVLQNFADLEKDVPGHCSETCATFSCDINQVIGVKAEEASDGEVEGGPMPVEFQGIENEPEVSCMGITSL